VDAQDVPEAGRWQCPRYYVCLTDNDPGPCRVRAPTGCTFRQQVCSNGHRHLARQLSERKIEYRIPDNSFGWIAGLERGQKLDVVFASHGDLQAISDRLTRAAIQHRTPGRQRHFPGP
jgi:hypothetical protein